MKIIPGKNCFAQHRLLVMGVKLAKAVYSKIAAKSQIKLRRLKDKKVRKTMEQQVEHASLYQVETWHQWSKRIIEMAKKMC